MEITEEKLQEMLEGAADKAVKSVVASLPTSNNGGFNVAVTHDEADTPFASIAAQCKAVKDYTLTSGRTMAPQLKRLETKAVTGASEAVPSEGGFLLEPTLQAGVLTPMHEAGPFSNAVRKLPVSGNSNYGWLNGVDETDRATGSRWGGLRGYRLAEGGTPTASKPKFRRINWELKKYGILVYGTDELLADASQFSAVVQQGAAEELSFMVNDDIFAGLGAAGPQGFMKSGCLVTVNKESGQAAATITNENLMKMWARMLTRSKRNSKWYYNTDCLPQLHQLTLSSGVSALEPRFVNYSPDGSLRIFGREAVETEFNETLGTAGDLVLADLSEYLYWDRDAVQAASSIHVAFLTDETVFRFLYRCDGQTVRSTPLTPYKGTSNTLSSFVALQTRS